MYANSLAGDSYSLPNAVSLSGDCGQITNPFCEYRCSWFLYCDTSYRDWGWMIFLSGTNVSIWLSGPNVTVHDSVHTLISPTQLDIGFFLPIYGGNNFMTYMFHLPKDASNCLTPFRLLEVLTEDWFPCNRNSANRAETTVCCINRTIRLFLQLNKPINKFPGSKWFISV